MRVKYYSLMRIWITILIIMNTSLTQIGQGFLGWFANMHHIIIITAISSATMAIICLTTQNIKTTIRPYTKYINVLCLYLLFLIIAESIYTGDKYSLSFSNYSYTFCYYSYLFLCYPLIYIALSDKKSWMRLLKCVVTCFVLSTILRWGVAIIFDSTGVRILPALMREYASDNWIRNGRIRIVPPCFVMIIIPILAYLSTITKSQFKRFYYYMVILGTIGFNIIVHQTRSVSAYLLVICYTTYMLKKKSFSKKMFVGFIILILCAVLMNTAYVSNIIDSFSVNGHFAGSTTARQASIVYYSALFLDNPLFGLGALWSGCNQTLSVLRGPIGHSYLEDLGGLGGIFRFGILGLILYVLIIVRMLKSILYLRKRANLLQDNSFMLLGSLFVGGILFLLNIDWFYGLIAFGMPFMLTIFEYYTIQVKINDF